MEFKQKADNTWEKRELTETKQWRLITKTGLIIEVKDPLSVPCPVDPMKNLQWDGIVPYFKTEPILSWGTGEITREGYYFDWFDGKWYEYYENEDFTKTFEEELKKLETERQERERIREMDELKERIKTLEDLVYELNRVVEILQAKIL